MNRKKYGLALKNRVAFYFMLILCLAILPFYNSIAREVIFEIQESLVGSDGLPKAEFTAKLSNSHFSISSVPEVEPLKLPVQCRNHPHLSRIFRINAANENESDALIDRIKNISGVVWVEKSPIRYACDVQPPSKSGTDAPPNDPEYQLQWSLHKIFADAAWDIARGDSSVAIAVIDVGVDIDHNDLFQNRWINYPELNGEADIDDDGNGFIDDVYGWDFIDDDPDPRPENDDSHGTHVAGIAAAATDNAYGIAGVSWNCRHMAVRAGSARTITYGYEGIIYAAASGADIINLSWGSNTPSNIERITIDYAQEQGALIVAAAGNRSNSSNFDHYPAAYQTVIGVAAVDTADRLAIFSNFGNWIEIAAPGASIISCMPGNQYGVLSGTSMATPIVAGAAALLKSHHPDWNADQLRLQLAFSADQIDNLNSNFADTLIPGRLNLYRCLSDSLSGFKIDDPIITEGEDSDNDGIFDPDEEINIVFELRNVLNRRSNLRGRIFTEDNYLQINRGEYDFGVIAGGSSANNADRPFIASIHRNAPSGRTVECVLILSENGIPLQTFPFIVHIRPPYVTHNNGSIAFTVTNFGALGYFDYRKEENIGAGLRFPKNGLSGLFHGSFMVGKAPGLVSDCAFGDSSDIRFDFASNNPEFALETEGEGVQVSRASYDDDRASHPLDVEVSQICTTYPEEPYDDFALMEYRIVNNGNNPLTGVRAALFLDWDIVQPNNNRCRWDGDSKIGWIEHSGGGFPVFGSALIGAETGFHVAIDNFNEWSSGRWNRWSDRAKFELMESGFENAENLAPSDYSQLIGASELMIAPGESVSLTFAVIAGENIGDLIDNLNAVKELWIDRNNSSDSKSVPHKIQLLSVYPQPFNSFINVRIKTTHSGKLGWTLFDNSGRSISRFSHLSVNAGIFNLPLSFKDLASGQYYLIIEQKQERLIAPVVYVK